jgi:hypothetical protein
LLDELKELAKERYVSPVNIAKIYVGLRERDRMFEYLEKALDERAVRLPWFFIDPALDGYRDNPRSLEIMRCVGLAQ